MTAVQPKVLRKPCYTLGEICQRWSVSEIDIANFAMVGELTLSVVVAYLPIEEGSIDEVDENHVVDIPERQHRFTGALDLWPTDAWQIVMAGSHAVSSFQAEPGRYRSLWPSSDSPELFEVVRDRVVLRHAELERFEAAQATRMDGPSATTPTLQRGSAPRYEWDAFWSEALVSVVRDGCPATLAEFVRRMEAWFASRGQYPDSSTIKKKLAVAWRQIAPLLRNAGS